VRTAVRWLRPHGRERLAQLGKRRSSKTDVVFAALLRLVPKGSWSLGLATALFPCGTLFGGLLAAAASGSPSTGAAMMVIFALASSPALLGAILLGGKVSHLLAGNGRARRVFAVAMLVLAGWAVAAPLGALARSNEPASCHAPSQEH
jgi:sulfite exporter TauE/SafE